MLYLEIALVIVGLVALGVFVTIVVIGRIKDAEVRKILGAEMPEKDEQAFARLLRIFSKERTLPPYDFLDSHHCHGHGTEHSVEIKLGTEIVFHMWWNTRTGTNTPTGPYQIWPTDAPQTDIDRFRQALINECRKHYGVPFQESS